MNRARLEHTAREVLPYVEPEELLMRAWKCDTTACAFGHECLSDYGRAQGLHLTVDAHQCWPTFKGSDGYFAVSKYYEIDKRAADWIFSPMEYGDNPSPAEVAERIESLLASES